MKGCIKCYRSLGEIYCLGLEIKKSYFEWDDGRVEF